MAERAIVEHHDYDGRAVVDRFYPDTGRFVSVSWKPPAAQFRSSGVAVGRAQLDAAAEAMRHRRPLSAADEPGWLVWAVAPDVSGRTVRFRGRKLSAGLDVLAEGVVPFHATRSDGWTLTASGVPLAEPLPPWLTAELGGRWRKPRAA